MRIAAAAAGIGFTIASLASAATVSWTGPAGNGWATGSSWSNASGPATGDTAFFGDAGSTNLPGEPTSVLNTSRTIGGMTFSNTINKYHTLDLATHTLTVTGNLNFNLDQSVTTTTIRNGALIVGGPFANINVGRAVAGSANGTADLTGLSSLTANVQEVNVATNTGAAAAGVLKLSPSNNITANTRVTVGASGSDGTLNLGLNNTITTPEFIVAKDHANALVDIVSNGTFNLGTPSVRTALRVADQTHTSNNTYQGRMLMGNAALNWNLDSLVVAQKQGGPGNTWGHVLGGGSGSVNLGTSAARGSFFVGHTINGGSTTGSVTWGNLGSLTAYVNDFYVGRAQIGSANGSVTLPATNLIDATNRVVVGEGAGGDGTLVLGLNNTILAGELSVGRDNNNGTVTIRNGGVLNLGSPARRVGVMLGVGNKNSNELDTGTLDLTGGSLNAYTNDLIVGQRDGIGGGRATGNLLAGNGGSIDIGAPGNTANFYVARTLAGGGPAAGTVDFTGLATLTASLNTFGIGVSQAGSAVGNVKLAASNTISANAILVGSGNGDALNSLQLGNANNIQTPQLTIGQEFSSGVVTIRSGGSLTLGSPSQRTNLSISTAGSTNTNVLYTGTLDLTNATVNAYLGNVIIGNKTLAVGGQQGNFVISNLPGNLVDATSITLGGMQSTGNLTFGGGQMYAGSIAAGQGTANFNWTGGRLSIGTFGTPSIPFNLVNNGTGTLAPGTAANPIGTTTINGSYQQGALGAMQVQIAGNTPATGNDLVNVSGNATFAGRLNLDVINGFVPAVGQNYAIANYAARSGTFGFVDPPVLPQNAAFNLSYGTTQLQVQMVAPQARTWNPSVATGNWSTPTNWNGGVLPTTSSDVSIVNNGAAAQKVTVNSPATVHRVTLQGNVGPVELEVLEGTLFGVANEIVVGANATLSGAGEIFAGGLTINAGAAAVVAGELETTKVTNGGTMTINGGRVTLTPSGGGANASRAGAIAFAGGGTLDVTDNKVILSGNVGTSNGSAYSGLSGLIQSAHNDGAWEGPGITTSMPDAASGLTSLGIATADETGYAGSTFGGVSVNSGDVLLMYTYAGDANLDGFISGDDYASIDGNVTVPGASGWYNGDFNYDGIISGDDYAFIDANIVAQGAPFPTGSAAAPSGVTAVPEPAAVAWIALAAGAGVLRGRRRRT